MPGIFEDVEAGDERFVDAFTCMGSAEVLIAGVDGEVCAKATAAAHAARNSVAQGEEVGFEFARAFEVVREGV